MCDLNPLGAALARTFQVYCKRIALLSIERIEVRIGYSFFLPQQEELSNTCK